MWVEPVAFKRKLKCMIDQAITMRGLIDGQQESLLTGVSLAYDLWIFCLRFARVAAKLIDHFVYVL